MREDLGAVFVYDTDLHAAALFHQLNALAPRWIRPRQRGNTFGRDDTDATTYDANPTPT